MPSSWFRFGPLLVLSGCTLQTTFDPVERESSVAPIEPLPLPSPLPAEPVAADGLPGNVLDNSGAETGLQGWTADFGGVIELTSELARSGRSSVLVSERAEAFQGAHRVVTALVQPDRGYTVRAFARVRGAPTDTLRLSAYLACGGTADQYLTLGSVTGSDTEWTALNGVIQIPSVAGCDLRRLSVYVEGPTPGVDLLVDDLQMAPLEQTEAPNLIDNTDFEGGTQGWFALLGGKLLTATDRAHSGEQSARITARTETHHGPYYDLTNLVEAGASYTARAFALHSAAAAEPLVMTARIECEGAAPLFQRLAEVSAASAQWFELSGALRVPTAAECVPYRILLYVEGPAAGVDLFVDDVSLQARAAGG
jgi:endo-1,4-beta-xylanase